MFWKNWNWAERGISLGFVAGAILLLISVFFSKSAGANFCPISGDFSLCVRFISLYPFVLAISGLVIGLIADLAQKHSKNKDLNQHDNQQKILILA